MILASRASIAEDLWRYGEDELHMKVAGLTASDLQAIGERAAQIVYETPSTRADGSSMYLGQALALAVVEFLEDEPRQLRLSRRRPKKDYPNDSGANDELPLSGLMGLSSASATATAHAPSAKGGKQSSASSQRRAAVPKKPGLIAALIDGIARKRRRPAKTGFLPRPAGVERSGDVYAQACERIASEFTADGYRYAKSGPHLSRASGDMRYQVRFGSTHMNVSGYSVSLHIYGSVSCRTLQTWRVKNGSVTRSDAWVAAGQIGSLLRDGSWMTWDLADAKTRDKEISSAIRVIREVALPYFAAFEDVPALCRRLAVEDVPSFSPQSAFDFLACFDTLENARAMLVRYLAERPLVAERYRLMLDQMRREGVPSWYVDDPSSVAKISLVYGFGNLAPA
jgi:hypothetical protein